MCSIKMEPTADSTHSKLPCSNQEGLDILSIRQHNSSSLLARSLALSLSLTHTNTHTRTHTCTDAHTSVHTHTKHTHTPTHNTTPTHTYWVRSSSHLLAQRPRGPLHICCVPGKVSTISQLIRCVLLGSAAPQPTPTPTISVHSATRP